MWDLSSTLQICINEIERVKENQEGGIKCIMIQGQQRPLSQYSESRADSSFRSSGRESDHKVDYGVF